MTTTPTPAAGDERATETTEAQKQFYSASGGANFTNALPVARAAFDRAEEVDRRVTDLQLTIMDIVEGKITVGKAKESGTRLLDELSERIRALESAAAREPEAGDDPKCANPTCGHPKGWHRFWDSLGRIECTCDCKEFVPAPPPPAERVDPVALCICRAFQVLLPVQRNDRVGAFLREAFRQCNGFGYVAFVDDIMLAYGGES